MTETVRPDLNRVLAVHPLVYLTEGDEVTIGRADTDTYAIFPLDGAAIVRRLADGSSPAEVSRWYEAEYGERVDIGDVIEALDELGFLRGTTDQETGPAGVRWQRTGRILFSPVALGLYALLVGWAAVAMTGSGDLVPTYDSLFYTSYYSVIEITLIVGVLPLLLAHEAFHALAGRRLGVRSRLRISRRLYMVVLETSLDGLVAVPRKKRYLPILAGLLFDVVALAALVVLADLTRAPTGDLSFLGRLCMALAFTTVLRIVWQFSFYLRTDLYTLITTALGCVDLHTASTRTLANRANRLLGRTDRIIDPAQWHPVDRRVARWYSWLVLVGYAFTLATLVLALLPILWRTANGVLGRLTGDGTATTAELVDSVVLISLTTAQIGASIWIGARERRRARASAYRHVIA
ncbi:MAG: hypothetical protein AVDCRST_MAG41-835 [uncultured Corynebacteriales bacterium]|uniref:PqqD family protein n=1 Tax=uncultured Mycobacteriales bacterium TaxID=581187 RepID=A0A6J4HN95_9ACTN|nr:MAG: hypothetical protein AVDCRST_MAG41-835 [uncultured Corynebacteriales bacterium]